MTYILSKLSSPGWTKNFADKEQLIDTLRSHICKSCLFGSPEEDYFEPVVDVIYEGNLYECRDVDTLLSTACGCEYDYEEIDSALEELEKIEQENY